MDTKRLLTLNDLYNYYANHSRSTHFSSKDKGAPIVVQVSGNLNFDTNSNATEGLLPVVLQSCHIDKNINQSIIEEDVMTTALPSFNNRPILGYIHEVDGEPHFYKHNMHEDEDGNIVYDEIPVGIVPESCDAKLEYDEKKDKTYVVVKGYIFEEYSKAAEILKREGECSVSVELSIREFSYNAKERCLVIEDFYFSGVTILGKTPDGDDVNPGMVGSNIKLADFSEAKNSLIANNYENHMIEIQKKLDEIISRFTVDNAKKGGDIMSHFEELLAKYNKSIDDIVFDYDGMSDEELDIKFEELFGVISFDDTEENNNNNDDDDIEDVNPEDDSNDGGVQDVVQDIPEETYARTYELSHDDIRCALYALLVPYEEADNDYYWISGVYDNYFVYEGYRNNQLYGQAYVKDDETVSFEGERYELFKEILTVSEKEALDAMRSNYEDMSNKLAAYISAELEVKKEDLLKSKDYASIRNNKDFISLVDSHSDISFEELQLKCDKILLDSAKAGNFSFEETSNVNSHTSKKTFASPSSTEIRKSSRYGSLFKEKEKE